MVIFLIIAGVILLVLYYGFFLLLVGAIPAGLRRKHPLDFQFCLSEELKALQELGWTKTDYSNLGEYNPVVHLCKDGRKADLMLVSPIDQSFYDKLLTMNGTEISLKDVENLKETISNLEELVFSQIKEEK